MTEQAGTYGTRTAQQDASRAVALRTTAIAAAEHSRALIEAKFLVALNHRRNFDLCRMTLLATCRRPKFAEKARYKKPVGKDIIRNLSIRFADEAVQVFGNIVVDQHPVEDTPECRVVSVTATDLESNTSKTVTIVIEKTVERKYAGQDREILRERKNKDGDPVFIVRATEDEMANKEAAWAAKVRRQLELQLIPRDLQEECEEAIIATVANRDAEDPAAERKHILDSFATLGVRPPDLAAYLGHALDTISPAELQDLREVWTAIDSGEATWKDFFAAKQETAETPPKPDPLAPGRYTKTGRKAGRPTKAEQEARQAAQQPASATNAPIPAQPATPAPKPSAEEAGALAQQELDVKRGRLQGILDGDMGEPARKVADEMTGQTMVNDLSLDDLVNCLEAAEAAH